MAMYDQMTDAQMEAFIRANRGAYDLDRTSTGNANRQNLQMMEASLNERRAKAAQQTAQMERMADIADPFRGQRAQYQTQLSDLMRDPAGALDKNPFFKANIEAGQDAAMRRLRAMGMGGSGNAAFELQNNAMANQSGNYFKLADLIGGFAGANQNPAAGAQAMQNQQGFYENQRQFGKTLDFNNAQLSGQLANQSWGQASANDFNNRRLAEEQRQFDLTRGDRRSLNNLGAYWGQS